MNKNRRKVSLLAFLFLSTLIQNNNKSFAAPIFARQTGFSCAVCHSPSFPRLNKFGLSFKENGFKVPVNEDVLNEKYASKVEPNLELLNNIPLAFRITGGIELKPSHKQIDFKLPSEVELISGGRLYKNVSFFLNQGLGSPFSPPPPIETAYIQLNNIFNENSFNIRAGKFGLMDWHFSPMRNLTAAPYLVESSNIGNNNFNLESNQIGIEIYGRPLNGALFYHLGIFDGNYDEGLTNKDSFDNNNYKDLFGGLKLNFLENQSVSFFGYYGNNTIKLPQLETKKLLIKAENELNTSSKLDIPYFSLGTTFHFNLNPIPLQLLLMGTYSSNLDNKKDLTYGGFAELTYSFTPNIFDYETTITPLIRYDFVSSKLDNKNTNESTITPSIQFLLIRNFIISLDYNINIYDHEKDKGIIRIQTAL